MQLITLTNSILFPYAPRHYSFNACIFLFDQINSILSCAFPSIRDNFIALVVFLLFFHWHFSYPSHHLFHSSSFATHSVSPLFLFILISFFAVQRRLLMKCERKIWDHVKRSVWRNETSYVLINRIKCRQRRKNSQNNNNKKD